MPGPDMECAARRCIALKLVMPPGLSSCGFSVALSSPTTLLLLAHISPQPHLQTPRAPMRPKRVLQRAHFQHRPRRPPGVGHRSSRRERGDCIEPQRGGYDAAVSEIGGPRRCRVDREYIVCSCRAPFVSSAPSEAAALLLSAGASGNSHAVLPLSSLRLSPSLAA
eukprot:531934-Rhodomonas_salina.2